jgi:DegV family protein with EDD domain
VTELPTTSQPTPGDFLATYEELSGYERIYSLQISSRVSGTYESARTAAAELGDKVRVIDTRTASAAITMLGFAIQRRLERGTTDTDIDALLERYHDDAHLLFTVDTLEFLQKGGRIGKAAAFAGTLLNVKPILTITDGEVVPVTRVRGNKRAVAEFAQRFTESTTDTPSLRVGIATADAPEREQALRALVADLRPQAQIEVATTLGAVVGTHAGPGTVGFFWFEDAG